MKKLLLKTLLLLFCMLAGATSAWATDEEYYTFTTAASGGNNAYGSTYDVTISGLDWNVPGNQYADGGLRIGGKGGKNASSVSTYDRIITGKSKMGAAITKITFNHGGVSNANCVVNSVTLTVASKSDFSDGVDYELTPSFSVSTNGSFDFKPTSPATEWDKDSYYKFTINQTITGSSNYFLLVKSIVFYKDGGGGGSDPSISASNVNIAQDATNGSIAYTLANATGNVSAVVTSGDWLTLGEITASAVPFTCSANTGAERTAQVTLSFTGATDKVVTITQAAKTVTKPEFNLDGGSYMQGTNITISSAGNTVYYNLTTDGSTPATPTNASTEYTAPIVLGSGTTKITAIAYDTYGNASSTTTRTYTGIALASLPFSWTGTSSAGKSDLGNKTGVALSLGSDYATSNAPYRLKFDDAGKYVIIYTDTKPETVYFTAKLLGGKADTGSKIKVQGSDDGITFTDIEEFTMKGAANATFEFATSNAFAATHRAVKLVMSSKDVNVGVGTICVNCIPITPAKTYTTLTSAYALDFTSVSSNLKAFIATEISAGKVQMTQVNKVPANTGLVLKATTPGSAVNVPVFDGTSADDVSENKMVGSATETTAIAANGGYILKDGVFQPATAGTLAAGKAYLAIAASGVHALTMSFDEEDGIYQIEDGKLNIENAIFDLSGRRVQKPTKGLYIVNGKKYIKK